MIRIDKLAYLMHELSVLCDQRKLFKENFLVVSMKEKIDTIMDKFNEFDQTLRSMLIFKHKKIIATYLRMHKRFLSRLVHS